MKGTGPDSLQSWRVASACCLIYLLQYGVSRLSGVLFVASMGRYGVGRTVASFPYTFGSVVTCVAGPIVGCLGKKFGVRSVAVFGSMFSAVGVGLCYVAEDIILVTLLFGILYGFGMACCISLLPVMINEHFKEKRATASGISLSGVCIGSFVIPPATQILIDKYGLSKTFLILSALLLCCLPASLLLRNRAKSDAARSREKEKFISGKPKMYSAVHQDTCKVWQGNDLEQIPEKNEENGCFLNEQHSEDDKNSCCNESSEKAIEENNSLTLKHKHACYSKTQNAILASTDHKKRPNVPISATDKYNFRKTKELCPEGNKADAQNCKDEKSPLIVSHITLPKPIKIIDKKHQARHVCVLLDPIFITTVTTVSMYLFMMVCLLTVIVDFAIDIGVNNIDQKYILMSISGGELVGRLSLGWITDGRHMSPTIFMAFSFLAQGLAALGVGLSNGFPMLMSMLAIHGFLHSGVPIVYPLIVADYIEEDKQFFTISASGFLSGPLSLCVSPLIGYFRDELGSYTYIFFGMSIISVICSFFWIVIPLLISERHFNSSNK